MIQFPIQEIIDEFSIPDTKKPDRDYWHPSALGGCPRGIFLERKGVECPEPFLPRTYRIFEIGYAVEKLIVDKLLKGIDKHGYKVEYQKQVEIPEWNVRGTYDIRITTPNGLSKIYDVKSCNSNKFRFMRERGGADEHYRQQVWLYLYATKTPEGAILYVSKDDQFLAEYPVFLDDSKLGEKVIKKLENLNYCWKTNTLPMPAPTFDDNGNVNWEASYCRWHTICVNNKNWKKEAMMEARNVRYTMVIEKQRSKINNSKFQ